MASRRKRSKRGSSGPESGGQPASRVGGASAPAARPLPPPRRLLRGWRLVALIVVSLGLAAVAASRFRSEYHLRQGVEALRIHRFDLADQHFERALRWSLGGAEIARLRSRAAWMNDHRQASQKHLADAEARGLSATSVAQERRLMQIRDGAAAEQHARLPSMLQRSPEDGPAILEAFTAGSLARGDVAGASGILAIWEQADPHDPRIPYWRGTLHQTFREPIAAVEYFQAALRIAPQMTPARLALAEVLKSHYLYREATPHYRQVVAEQPDSRQAHISLAVCLIESGAVEEGVQRLRAAIDEYPDDFSARLALAEFYQHQGKWQSTLELLDPPTDADQNDITLNYLLANAYQQTGDPVRSEQYFDQFQRLNQILETTRLLSKEYESRPSPELARRVAAGYMESEWQEAGTWIMKAMESDPNGVALHRMMADYLHRSGRTTMAQSYEDRADSLVRSR